MWHSIQNKPKQSGLYVVAEFDSEGNMVAFNDDYACICEPDEPYYWGPNDQTGYAYRMYPTHYMTRKEYKDILANIPRE